MDTEPAGRALSEPPTIATSADVPPPDGLVPPDGLAPPDEGPGVTAVEGLSDAATQLLAPVTPPGGPEMPAVADPPAAPEMPAVADRPWLADPALPARPPIPAPSVPAPPPAWGQAPAHVPQSVMPPLAPPAGPLTTAPMPAGPSMGGPGPVFGPGPAFGGPGQGGALGPGTAGPTPAGVAPSGPAFGMPSAQRPPAFDHPALVRAGDGPGSMPSPASMPAPAPSSRPASMLGHAGSPAWAFDSGIGVVQPRSAVEVLSTLATKVAAGDVEQYQPVPLGFSPLDKGIGGGLRAGELLLIGGAQGTGKTTMAVQMARNIVMGGQASVLYICFEHDEEYLLNRIIAMESVLPNLPNLASGVKLADVRREILGTWLAQGGQEADLTANPRLRPALERMSRYGPNLYLLRGSQTTSTVDNLRHLVSRYKELSGDRRLVVFIDYMQKVPVIPDPPTETEKVTTVVNGLKDLALSLSVPMIAIVAADKEGLKAARLRNHHLRGSSAINYEADIILILNEKYQIVAKVNIEFNPYQAQRFRDWVITTLEKNRGGTNSVDLEFHKHFEYSCFDPNGRTVMEKLIEERLYND